MSAFLAWQLVHNPESSGKSAGWVAFAAKSLGLHRCPGELNRMLNLGVGVVVYNLFRRITLEVVFPRYRGVPRRGRPVLIQARADRAMRTKII
jgi:hypothetical protein